MTYYVGMRKVSAECEDCGKVWQGMNAQAVGAIHARKYNHEVCVEILQYIIYGGEKNDHNKISQGQGFSSP